MENTNTNFTSLKKWVKKSKEVDMQHESEMKVLLSQPVKVTTYEKVLAYGIVIFMFGFIIALMLR